MLNISRKRRLADASLPSVPDIELPLDSPEQIELSLELDGALERRAQRRKVEREVEAAAIANDRDRFHLLSEKIYLGAGLLILLLVAIGAVLLWLSGEERAALFVVASSSGLGAANLFLRQRRLRRDGERD